MTYEEVELVIDNLREEGVSDYEIARAFLAMYYNDQLNFEQAREMIRILEYDVHPDLIYSEDEERKKLTAQYLSKQGIELVYDAEEAIKLHFDCLSEALTIEEIFREIGREFLQGKISYYECYCIYQHAGIDLDSASLNSSLTNQKKYIARILKHYYNKKKEYRLDDFFNQFL